MVPGNQYAQVTVYDHSELNASSVGIQLNYDIMFQIMQAQDIWSKADLLSVMSTCKTLYRSGIPFLLQRPVYITDTNVKSFCDYMLSDITFRGPALRHFYLQHLPPQHEQVRRFPAIFQHAIHLVTFSVAESEQLLEEVPEMIDIVSSLLKVTELEVWLAGHRSIELFRRLDQRLLRLGASLCDTNEEFELQEPLIAPPHLETLVLDHIDIRLFTEACTSLQQLEVGGASLNESLETLVRFCPHLRCLILKGQLDHWWEELDLVDTAHTFNTQYVQSEAQQWTKLDRVDGPLHLLYSLAIPCQVHDLRVTPYRVKHITAAFWLFTVLMEYRPQTLVLEMDSDDLDMDIFEVMHSLESSTSELKSFAMHVTLSDDFGHMDRLLTNILRFIQCSSLVEIEIKLLNGISANLSDVVSSYFAQRVHNAIRSPTLHRIALENGPHVRSVWKITNGTVVLDDIGA